ncbi:MAG: DMT family transporter [Candidatus Micrarchaeota archaeon]
MKDYSKGIMLALITAIISGISVFVNGFAIKLSDPIVYVTLKNVGALVFLVVIAFALNELKNLKKLSRKQIGMLVLIGIIGGSVPFALFFWGLKLGGAAISSFIFRSLFIFAAVFGYLILKEKPERNDLIAAFLILAGNALLVSGELSFGLGQVLVLFATLLWALEYTLSRKMLSEVAPRTVMVSRMLFGSIVLLCFLFFTGSFSDLLSFTPGVLPWLALTSLLLFGFVSAWYSALKYLPVAKAAAILTLGGIVTMVLNAVFLKSIISISDILSILLIVVGCAVAIKLGELSNLLKQPINSKQT